MHDYSELKRKQGHAVNQTLDAPIIIFEFWEIGEIFFALFLILVFGVLFYEWLLMTVLLGMTLIGLPYLRRNFNKGMVFHYPYSRFKMTLPGLIQPRGKRIVSD